MSAQPIGWINGFAYALNMFRFGNGGMDAVDRAIAGLDAVEDGVDFIAGASAGYNQLIQWGGDEILRT
jgi:hypothetical protein